MDQRDAAATIFSQISLLELKRSARILCQLESAELEDFVKKYSGIVIFLLNVLDRVRAEELLSRLTDASIIYLIEEELRIHLIREVARVSSNLDDLVDLSNYLEAIDRAGVEGKMVEGASRVLGFLADVTFSRSRANFAYLDTMSKERLKTIFAAVTKRNLHVSFGVIIHATETILCDILDEIATAYPSALSACPGPVLAARFRHEHSLYMTPGIFENLPDKAKQTLTRLSELRTRFHSTLEMISDIKGTAADKRRRTMDLISRMLDETEPDLHSLLLTDLSVRGALTTADQDLLRALAESRSVSLH